MGEILLLLKFFTQLEEKCGLLYTRLSKRLGDANFFAFSLMLFLYFFLYFVFFLKVSTVFLKADTMFNIYSLLKKKKKKKNPHTNRNVQNTEQYALSFKLNSFLSFPEDYINCFHR